MLTRARERITKSIFKSAPSRSQNLIESWQGHSSTMTKMNLSPPICQWNDASRDTMCPWQNARRSMVCGTRWCTTEILSSHMMTGGTQLRNTTRNKKNSPTHNGKMPCRIGTNTTTSTQVCSMDESWTSSSLVTIAVEHSCWRVFVYIGSGAQFQSTGLNS